MTKAEILNLVAAFVDPTDLYRNGIYIEGKPFTCLSAHASVIVGRSNDQTVTVSKCRTCVIVGIHQHKANSNVAHMVVVKVANYLSEQRI